MCMWTWLYSCIIFLCIIKYHFQFSLSVQNDTTITHNGNINDVTYTNGTTERTNEVNLIMSRDMYQCPFHCAVELVDLNYETMLDVVVEMNGNEQYVVMLNM